MRTAAGLVPALRAAAAAAAAPSPAVLFNTYWNASKPAPPRADVAAIDWRAHAVRPVRPRCTPAVDSITSHSRLALQLDVHPKGKAPPNLWLSAGGSRLHRVLQHDEIAGAAAALRAAFAAMPDTVVLIDTDAEVSERPCSSLGCVNDTCHRCNRTHSALHSNRAAGCRRARASASSSPAPGRITTAC